MDLRIRLKKQQIIFAYVALVSLFVGGLTFLADNTVKAWSTSDFACDEVEDKKSGNITCHFSIVNTARYARNGCPDGAPTHVGYCEAVSDGCNASLTDPGCGNMTTVCELGCPCTDVECVVQNASKWRRTGIANGSYNHCNGNSMNCSPTTGACAPKYVNSPVSCSITPIKVVTARGVGGVQFTLTASDYDYGDEVRITGFNVKDTSGNLNNCVNLQTVGGGSVLGATVKPGFPDSNPLTSQNNVFVANPDLMHGIFEKDPLTGESVCKGTLTVEVRDVQGDSLDTTSYATCSVNINIHNNAPTISNIKVTDLDNYPSLRTPSTQNLINGSRFFVGSVLESKRASYCSSAMLLTTLGPDGCTNKVPFASRKNPFMVSYTITDNDGIKDILQAGLWIQRADKNANARALPLVENGVRNSIQVLYSEKENVNFAGRWYFNNRACIGSTCSPNTIIGSPKQLFSGLSLITGLGGSPGSVTNAPYKSSTFRQWQLVGYPDCFLSVEGCTLSNIPTASKDAATTEETKMANYDWATAADFNSLLCFKNNSPVVQTYPAGSEKCLGSNEVCPVCPVGCAACAQKAGITSISDTQAEFRFKIFFNDRDGGQSGMDAGDYRIFVSALDKVGAPLHSVAGLGDEGWLKFDKNGSVCTSGTCSNGDFVLTYDPISPTVSNISPHISGDDSVSVSATYTDQINGSGIAGESYMFMYTEELVDGEPSERGWMKKADGVTPYNGANENASIAGSPIIYNAVHNGKGAIPGNNVGAGYCAYDRAGNMGCSTNGINYVFVSSWLKTSLGDIYSNASSSGYAFKNLTIPNTTDLTGKNPSLTPYTYTGNSAATGIVMSGGNIGIAGGLNIGAIDYPLGFSTYTPTAGNPLPDNYRTTALSVFNMTNFQANLESHEFDRMKALSARNCDLLSVKNPNVCKSSNSITDTNNSSSIKIITLSGTMTIADDITCKNTNVLIVTDKSNITLTGQVKKYSNASGCLFVLGPESTLTIGDVATVDSISKPGVDKFEASVIAGKDAQFTVAKNQKNPTTKRYDRLEIFGFIYSANKEPLFKRILPSVDNRKYPAEWMVYDANVLDTYRDLLGLRKTVDVVCGTSSHLLCGEK